MSTYLYLNKYALQPRATQCLALQRLECHVGATPTHQPKMKVYKHRELLPASPYTADQGITVVIATALPNTFLHMTI